MSLLTFIIWGLILWARSEWSNRGCKSSQEPNESSKLLRHSGKFLSSISLTSKGLGFVSWMLNFAFYFQVSINLVCERACNTCGSDACGTGGDVLWRCDWPVSLLWTAYNRWWIQKKRGVAVNRAHDGGAARLQFRARRKRLIFPVSRIEVSSRTLKAFEPST